jgi:DNA polymerase I-like protein with 3'-5' exonuclease and polymerase domains
MHSFVTAHFLSINKQLPSSQLPDLKWSDSELKLYLKDIKNKHKELRDTRCKPAILGYGFGMGPNKLHTQNDETISLRDAKILMKLLDDLFPIAKKWRQDIKQLADRQGYLVSRHGFVRWFWDVYSRKFVDGKWVITNGSDAEDAIAFLPANDGHCHMQEVMVKLEKLGVNERLGLINMIHDALLFLMPLGEMEKGIEVVKRIMTQPSSVLVDPLVAPQGLAVEVEIVVGKSWDKMEEWKG